MTPFVAVAFQRTGSTWLISTLDSHPHITRFGELFLEDPPHQPTAGATGVPFWEHFARQSGVDSRAYSEDILCHYLDREVFGERSGSEAIGFKLMYGQAGAHPALRDYLRFRNAAIIHLTRSNLLDIVTSMNAAVARDVFHARRPDEIAEVGVRVNAGELRQRLAGYERQIERARADYRALGGRYVEVQCEQLVAAPDGFRAIVDALGVSQPDHPMSSPLLKLNTKPRQELIENFDAVERALRGTRFEWMLA